MGLVAVAAELADFAVGLLDLRAESSGLTAAAAYSTVNMQYHTNIKFKFDIRNYDQEFKALLQNS